MKKKNKKNSIAKFFKEFNTTNRKIQRKELLPSFSINNKSSKIGTSKIEYENDSEHHFQKNSNIFVSKLSTNRRKNTQNISKYEKNNEKSIEFNQNLHRKELKDGKIKNYIDSNIQESQVSFNYKNKEYHNDSSKIIRKSNKYKYYNKNSILKNFTNEIDENSNESNSIIENIPSRKREKKNAIKNSQVVTLLEQKHENVDESEYNDLIDTEELKKQTNGPTIRISLNRKYSLSRTNESNLNEKNI